MNRTSERISPDPLQLSAEGLLDSFFHKLSQPIGALYGSLELGQLSEDPKELKAAIDAGLLQVERLMWLFQVTREFFSIDFSANSRPVSLRECLQSALDDTKPLAETSQVVIQPLLQQDLKVVANPNHLLHAIENVLARSIRHSPPGAAMTVELLAHADAATVRISDQVPCSPDLAEKAFEPFPAGAQIGPGETGNLDLALSRRIVRSFAGDVRLRLTPQRTQQFEIVLPAA
jgi:signal transduction histidine kinase